MNKKILIPALLVVVSGATIFGASLVRAQETTSQKGPSLLIQNLVDKFNLKSDEVEEVFTSTHQQQRAQMQADFESRLTDAVSSGELTEAQKLLILQKHSELNDKQTQGTDEWFNLSPEERRAKADSQHQELEDWANSNGIDLKYFFQGRQDGQRGGRGMGQGRY